MGQCSIFLILPDSVVLEKDTYINSHFANHIINYEVYTTPS